eukprot:CAMPEP_0170588694 /NCGR_PEP_ID=MMETSP0224-20130122/10969_1 /TAXON_ID=285029 /ORGANISM="Togula jolla, Strain CCCM 725" /LENGTH=41 /DNA_ID= /DNA_START= /DNA_END= /DNA_ORIENTATION=
MAGAWLCSVPGAGAQATAAPGAIPVAPAMPVMPTMLAILRP